MEKWNKKKAFARVNGRPLGIEILGLGYQEIILVP